MYLIIRETIFYILTALLLLVLSPIMLVVAIVVKVTSKGPVLFKQQRVGKNGNLFTLYKFRSMHRHAEKRHHKKIARNEMDVFDFKDAADSEVTAIGRVIRKTSLDELPQLFNILKGEMSVIGPRPLQQMEVDGFMTSDSNKQVMAVRLQIKPGLICTWQVTPNKNTMPFDERMQMDADYVKKMSLTGDINLIVKGIQTVTRGSNQ